MNDDLAIAMGERLERIAVALEAIQAHLKPSELAAFHGEEARTTQEPVRWAPSSGPVDPEPPFPGQTVGGPAPVWVCPIHHGSRIQPPGALRGQNVTSKTGTAYTAFLVCTDRDCKNHEPKR